MIPSSDFPGVNTELQPERAPVWMREFVIKVQAGELRKPLERALRPDVSIDRSRRAAVLVLLSGADSSVELPNDAAVLLTHRSPQLRAHSGQIAFPGGRIDPTDANMADCALREAWEETGLDRRTVTPLVALPEVHIRATGYPVHPIVAHWHSISPTGVVDPAEADAVFAVPLAALIDPANRLTVSVRGWHGPAFWFEGYLIWGFTAAVLDAIITHAGWEQPWDKQTAYDLEEKLAQSRNNEQHS